MFSNQVITFLSKYRPFWWLVSMVVLFTVSVAAGETNPPQPALTAPIPPGISSQNSSPANGDPFKAAIKEAEADLQRMDKQDKLADKTWTVSDYLSLIALVAAFAIMLLATRWIRRSVLPGGQRGREMLILDRMAISRRSTLLLVRLRGRDYWVAEHPQGVVFLADVTPALGAKPPTIPLPEAKESASPELKSS